MESTPKKAPRSKFPALLVVALALVALVFVIWRVDSAPSTNDAYASADTIDVVPEVSGRIVELAVTDNQAVKQGDLLFRIDPRPYEANLAKAEASLAALDKQIKFFHNFSFLLINIEPSFTGGKYSYLFYYNNREVPILFII